MALGPHDKDRNPRVAHHPRGIGPDEIVLRPGTAGGQHDQIGLDHARIVQDLAVDRTVADDVAVLNVGRHMLLREIVQRLVGVGDRLLLVPFREEAANDRGRSMSSVSVVLREVFPVGTTLFLTSLFQRIGVLLLSIFATDLDVSVFGTAFRLVSTAGFLSTSMFVSSFAALVRAIEINDVRSVGRIVRREMHLVSLVFVPACLLGILFCIPLTRALLPADMLPVAQAMVILCPGLYLSCINMGMKYTVNAWSLNWPDVVAVVIGILIFADSIWMFSHISWSVGAAIGWGAGEGGVLLLRIALLRYAGKPSGVPVASILMSTCVLVVAAFWAIH